MEVHAQQAMRHAHGALLVFLVLQQVADANRRGKLHAGFAAQNKNRQQFTQATGNSPAVGENQLPRAGFAARRLAPEHRDRHNLRIGHLALANRLNGALKARRHLPFVGAAKPAGRLIEGEIAVRLAAIAQGQRQNRARQLGFAALQIHHR